MTNYEVVISRGDAEPIKVVLDTHDAEQAEAAYENVRAAIEEGQLVKAPSVELGSLSAAVTDLAVDPREVTAVDLVDADEEG